MTPAEDRAAATETARARTRAHRTRRRAPRACRRGAWSSRVTPSTPTYVCVDSGAGTEVSFEGTLDAAQTVPRPPPAASTSGRPPCELRVERHAASRSSPVPRPVGFEFTPAEPPEPLPLGRAPLRVRRPHERPRRHRRDGHRGAHRADQRPQRPLARRPPARAGRRAGPHHDHAATAPRTWRPSSASWRTRAWTWSSRAAASARRPTT